MNFFDTQILSYKFNNNKTFLDKDIKEWNIVGSQISSVVALEFLNVMEKGCNRAKMYPTKLMINHPSLHTHPRLKRKGCSTGKLGYHITDKLIIDFNGEFDSIVIYSNEAISQLINQKDINGLLFFASFSLCKKDFRLFRKKVQFLIDSNLSVVPLTQEIVDTMHHIYEESKGSYNVKANYRNSFMDLLILATAITYKKQLYTLDKELQKLAELFCYYDVESDFSHEISGTDCSERIAKKTSRQDNKGFINNKWRLLHSS